MLKDKTPSPCHEGGRRVYVPWTLFDGLCNGVPQHLQSLIFIGVYGTGWVIIIKKNEFNGAFLWRNIKK